MRRIVVVGGGIAGLTIAFRLQSAAQVTVIEERDRLGGTIVTEREGGFVVEGGPDSFLATKPWAAELCRELGLGDRLIAPSARTVYVLSRRRLMPLPEGVFLTVPTRIVPFLESPLISWAGKFRMGLDLVLPRGQEAEDESLGSFVRRRLGREALDKIAEPIMAGIYLGDADRLSLKSTFPRFLDLEREHRSLILGLRRIKTTGNTSPFMTLRGGMGELVQALVATMKDVTFRTRAAVRRIEPGWKVHVDDGPMSADAVVLAVPPESAASLVRPFAPALADRIAKIRVVGSATVSLGYRGARLPEGTGFVIPRRERRRIIACTWSSQKFEGRAPAGHVLLRCFLVEPCSDPVAVAREEVREILGIRAEPVIAKSFRWPGANPVYEVGHQALVREIDALTPAGLYLTGSGFRGVGIPDCVRDAAETAARMVAGP